MTIEVYWGNRSPYSARVLLALEIKRIPYESRCLRFSEADLKSAEFLAINPRGQVPAIRDGEFTLHESIAILCYLDKKHPEPPLFAGTAAEQGRIWRIIMECVYYLEPHMTHFAGVILSGELEEKQFVAIQSRKAVEQEFSCLNDILGRNEFLAGQRISAADVAVYPVVQLLVSAAQMENSDAVSGALRHIEKHFPKLNAWCTKIEAIPGFDRIGVR